MDNSHKYGLYTDGKRVVLVSAVLEGLVGFQQIFPERKRSYVPLKKAQFLKEYPWKIDGVELSTEE